MALHLFHPARHLALLPLCVRHLASRFSYVARHLALHLPPPPVAPLLECSRVTWYLALLSPCTRNLASCLLYFAWHLALLLPCAQPLVWCHLCPSCPSSPLSPARLTMVIDGIFGSKLVYGITVWGRLWHIPGTQEEDMRSLSLAGKI